MVVSSRKTLTPLLTRAVRADVLLLVVEWAGSI
jgi:hypothetical protein